MWKFGRQMMRFDTQNEAYHKANCACYSSAWSGWVLLLILGWFCCISWWILKLRKWRAWGEQEVSKWLWRNLRIACSNASFSLSLSLPCELEGCCSFFFYFFPPLLHGCMPRNGGCPLPCPLHKWGGNMLKIIRVNRILRVLIFYVSVFWVKLD